MKKHTAILQMILMGSLIVIFTTTTLISRSFAQKESLIQETLSSTAVNYSSQIEMGIRSGEVTTADLIVDGHPRLWMKGNWDWNPNNYGSFAWRIMHGETQAWPWGQDPANDQEKGEFLYSAGDEGGGSYGADEMYQNYDHDYDRRVLEPIIAGKAQKLNWGSQWSGGSGWSYNLSHTADEYLADARAKLLHVSQYQINYEYPYVVTLFGSVAYDWLVDETYTNGSPVLSEEDKSLIRERLMAHADYLQSQLSDSLDFFNPTEIDTFYFGMVGMALYEPSAGSDYAVINSKAKGYLDSFDQIVNILAVWNEQGGDGGWHSGLSNVYLPFYSGGTYESEENAAILAIAPVLYAHYTATGVPIEESLFNTGVLKNFAEFQAHMIRPTDVQSESTAPYYEINGAVSSDSRSPWITPMIAYARRRSSTDSEQQRIGELGAWIRTSYSKRFTDYGSWDTLYQLIFEDKWINPRSPDQIGFETTRRFNKLGWVFMRSGFTSANDLAALFIAQRFHWSDLNTYSQNSFTLERKGKLIEGFQNSIHIDSQYQRTISTFPTLADGVEAYAPGSIFDVGPGILTFMSNDIYDYILGDASNAYDTSKLSKFTRQVVFLKPDIFVIFDNVVTASASINKSWVIDPGAAPVSAGNNIYTITNGNGALWIKALSPQATTVDSQTASQFKITASANSTEAIFIHVMQAVDAGSSASQVAVDDATLVQQGDWFHVTVASHTVSFSRSGEFAFDGGSVVIKGDLNDDGIIDQNDTAILVSVILGSVKDPMIIGKADVNEDGQVNTIDLQWIVNQILKE